MCTKGKRMVSILEELKKEKFLISVRRWRACPARTLMLESLTDTYVMMKIMMSMKTPLMNIN